MTTYKVNIGRRDARSELVEDGNNYRRFLETVPVPMMIHSEWKIVYVNDAFAKEFGAQRSDLIGLDVTRLIFTPQDLQNIYTLYSGQPVDGQLSKATRMDGAVIDVQYCGVPVTYRGRPAVIIVAQNISNQTDLSDALERTQEQFAHVLQNLDVGIWSYDALTDRMVASSGIVNTLIFSAPEADRMPTLEQLWRLVRSGEPASTFESFREQLRSGALNKVEFHVDRPNGRRLHYLMRITVSNDATGRPAKINGVLLDVTEQVEASARAAYHADHDELTGLPNRRYFLRQLKEQLERAKSEGRMAALIYMDLDRFKYINDSLGHAAGDKLLSVVSERLKSIRCDFDAFISRLAGDEFTIILNGFDDVGELSARIEQILERFQDPVIIEGYPFYVKASMGVALYPEHGASPETLLNHADSAMFKAKETRNTYRFYRDDENTMDLADIRLQHDLQHALAKGELSLHFQPKCNVKTKLIVGSEALLRWTHPELGSIPPLKFIPFAEDSGAIHEIGRWVIQQVCRQIRAWTDRGIRHAVSLNLSARQFQSGDLVNDVETALRTSGIEPHLLELEITEGIAMDLDKVMDTLTKLNALGVSISIDDFGTGYSSLNYLKKLPVHKLKIDRSFIRDLNVDHGDAAIVSTIVALAHNMQLKVIAEGVESGDQLEILEGYDCDEVQGYFFGKPLPLDEFERLLRPTESTEGAKASERTSAVLKGQFCKFVLNSLIAGEKKFPEYREQIARMDDDEWYSWDFYTGLLQEISKKVTDEAVLTAGKNVVRNGKKFFMEELGYRTLDQLLQDYRNMFDQTIVGLPDHERIGYVHYEPGRCVIHYTVRQPLKFSEGVLIAFFEIYQRELKRIESRQVNEHYYEYTMTW